MTAGLLAPAMSPSCLSLLQTGHRRRVAQCPLAEQEQTSTRQADRSAYEPSERRLDGEQTDNGQDFLRRRGRSVKPVQEKRTCAAASRVGRLHRRINALPR
jgi:hypothetical protein